MVDTTHGGSKTGSNSAPGGGLLGRPLECIVVTPEATVLESTADFVALPLYDGEIGIAPGHSPLIGRLGYGEMRIVSGNQTRHFYVDGGFVQVAGNLVSVLTSRAVPTSEIDARVAAERLAVARSRRADSDELLAERETLEAQARAQLRAARKT
jgi:F-type H+-transporting ATPase subunit epsilon